MSKLEKIYPNSAGIDIGSEKVFVAIEDKEVKQFPTFTEAYIKLIDYLKENNITHVAMEATGIYWFALYDMIERSGIKVSLVNPREVKNVPGRKSDVADCQWIQQLYSFGLLRECFVPEESIRQLRTYIRLRNDHISMASQHIQHMQKALDSMNIKLHNVISKINGVSGMRILKAILKGERNPETLVNLCENSILKKKKSLVISSLKGNFRTDYIFALRQAVSSYEFYQQQILECDKQIEILLNKMTKDKPLPDNINPPKPIRHNPPQIDKLHEKLMQLTDGKDPSQITGLSDKTLMEAIAATGLDLQSNWKNEKYYVSWLGLSPSKNQSGKSNKKSKRKCNTQAGQIFREAAQSIANSKYSALAGFYRRIKARKGGLVANKATARKIAVTYYNIMTKGYDYVEQGLIQYQKNFKEQQIKRLKKQAKYLRLQVILE